MGDDYYAQHRIKEKIRNTINVLTPFNLVDMFENCEPLWFQSEQYLYDLMQKYQH